MLLSYLFTVSQFYTYDDLNRLIRAGGMATEGKSDDGSAFNAYTMSMDYNRMSSPLNYELAIMNPTGTKLTNFDYLYGTDIQPNAPIKVGDMTYTYDASGNPITIDGEEVGRSMTYDSDNRLREIMDYRKNIMSRYTYNHAGERAVKRYGAFESMAVNGAPAGSKLDANAKYSAYVSPYYVENGSGTKSGAFSKHYYAGSDRIASKTADDAYFYFSDHLGSTTHITDRSGDVAQYAAYTPYGSLFREYRSVQPYKFNGKELDQETGYYYYGARYYDPTTALWLGTDPLKHKYPDIGAYVYCAGNPVRYVDSDGREIFISGKLSDDAISQLQGQMNDRITLSMGENGKLSYTVNDGHKLIGDAKRMASMIDDQLIIVNLITTDKNVTSTGKLMIGGAFMGNTVTIDSDGNVKVMANQEVNPNVLGIADAHTNTRGKMMMHEATEAYAGAQISQKVGVGVGSATQVEVANPESVYNRAHNKATSQTSVYQTMYDISGKVTYDIKQAVKAEWYVTKNGKSKIIQTLIGQ